MEKICDSYSTGALYDFVSRSENLEEYRNILESLADQKQNWTYIINDIMKERGLSASKMAELCGVSRQSVQKWLKGSVPKSRETYIKIGFAAHYNLKQMNYFLQRYGCVNKLYPKYLEDSVCIFVLSSDCIEHSYQACEKVINMIKNEIFDDVPRSEGKEYTTSALELDITNLRSLQEMVSFVKEHAQMYKQKYYPMKILQYMMKHQNIIPIIGNHEVMALPNLKLLVPEISKDFLQGLSPEEYQNFAQWTLTGGTDTIQDFRKLPTEERRQIMEYIESFRPYGKETINSQEYWLVHAGLDEFSETKALEEYTVDELVWTRIDYEIPYFEDIIVVSGHTPTQKILGNSKPGFIFRANNHIAIDCGAAMRSGRLAAICLDTGAEYYAEV